MTRHDMGCKGTCCSCLTLCDDNRTTLQGRASRFVSADNNSPTAVQQHVPTTWICCTVQTCANKILAGSAEEDVRGVWPGCPFTHQSSHPPGVFTQLVIVNSCLMLRGTFHIHIYTTVQTHAVRSTGHSKLSIGVNNREWCLSYDGLLTSPERMLYVSWR